MYPNENIRRVFLGSAIALFALPMMGAMCLIAGADEEASITIGVLGLAGLGWLFATGFYWIYDTWNGVPTEGADVPLVGRMTPGLAAGLLLVPVLNVPWLFIANTSLADALNHALRQEGSSREVPKWLAIAACGALMIPFAQLVLGTGLFYWWMLTVDQAREELARLRGPKRQWHNAF